MKSNSAYQWTASTKQQSFLLAKTPKYSFHDNTEPLPSPFNFFKMLWQIQTISQPPRLLETGEFSIYRLFELVQWSWRKVSVFFFGVIPAAFLAFFQKFQFQIEFPRSKNSDTLFVISLGPNGSMQQAALKSVQWKSCSTG